MAQGTQSTSGAIAPGTVRIGLIGIGNMGTPMGANLAKAGWQLTVYDTDPAKVEGFVKANGGTAAETLEEIGKTCRIVITMLPDGHIVRKVVLGADERSDCLVRGMERDAVIVDMSSSSPVGTRELGKELAARGIHLLDAPVSGGVRGAVAGTLAIMVGGDRELAEQLDGLLAPMGRRFYVGTLGAGHAAKVLNNYVSAAGLAAAAEALHIAERFGIEPPVILDVINASTGRNNSTENKFAQFIFNRKFNSGFALGLMAKDLTLAMEVAEACDVPAELGHATLKLWKDAETKIGGRSDHTEIARYVSES
ncbi:MAG: NAD(P)-dependent oxidoreductase [Rhodospirillaceae bacterium]